MEQITTIKITKETKKRLTSLDISEKNKTFDALVNELASYYLKNQGKYKKDYSEWEKSFEKSKKDKVKYEKQRFEWAKKEKRLDSLLDWSKKQGFKG